MRGKFYKIFKGEKVIIGVIHFPPLLGYPEFPGFEITLENALKDLKAFEDGGVDGVIIENNYDIPHKIEVNPKTVEAMLFLGKKIKKQTKLPIGVNVLWNDFRASLFIGKKIGARFIRIPVFVDKVKTDYGNIAGNPAEVLRYQKEIKAENTALFTDIQVKHAELLDKRPIEESAKEAVNFGSDALIITGKWTGQAPDFGDLAAVRKAIGKFPILVGSGAEKKNINRLLKYADGVIVSTSLKEGGAEEGEVNVKTWRQRIDKKKVKELVEAVKVR